MDEGEVGDDLVEVIKERLESGEGLVQVAGHEALQWPVAGKAAVLVYLPGATSDGAGSRGRRGRAFERLAGCMAPRGP